MSPRECWRRLNGDSGHAGVVGDKDGTRQHSDGLHSWHRLVSFGRQGARTSGTEPDWSGEMMGEVADARGH